jgi:hypothetical protein
MDRETSLVYFSKRFYNLGKPPIIKTFALFTIWASKPGGSNITKSLVDWHEWEVSERCIADDFAD